MLVSKSTLVKLAKEHCMKLVSTKIAGKLHYYFELQGEPVTHKYTLQRWGLTYNEECLARILSVIAKGIKHV